MGELHDRYAAMVLRIVTRILGPDRDVADVHHDAFVRALQSIDDLREPSALPGWMRSIAVHTARAAIEKRVRRRRWFVFLSEDALPEPEPADDTAYDEAREALRETYAVLERLPVDERIVFALRYVDGMDLADAAESCRVSLATFKRRLARAETRFVALARRSPVLADWLEGGARWTR